MDRMMASAASTQPMWRSIISADRISEPGFGELLDIAFVHQGDRFALVVDGVLVRLANQALRALDRDWLDADRRGVREADLLDLHLLDQKIDDLFCFRGLGGPLDPGI